MKIPINLASQPFRRDRLAIVALALAIMALAGTLGMLVSLALASRAELAGTRGAIARLERQTRAAAAEQARLEGVLHRPENFDVLERSIFLNTLLYRKGISWTRILADLEQAMPHNVRVVSIRPWVNARNEISLEMNVGAEALEPMIEMLKQLQASPVFSSVAVHSTLPPSQSEPLYRCRVSVNYAQKL
jgi:type IV pilus assembly protein PilN